MYEHSFLNQKLPESTQLHITLIPKQGKSPEEPSSYRPISLQCMENKILAKLLAKRLDSILPTIIGPDQTGFVQGRHSYTNVSRLLGVIQYAKNKPLDSMVVSLDAEKAFDRIKWKYMFNVLKRFSLGSIFISWVKLLYTSPQAMVMANGLTSPRFTLGHGTRQGCPLSPLLFSIAIEPLAEAIRTHPQVNGINNGKMEHVISLYTDDILLFLGKPRQSIPAVQETIN